MSFVIPEAWHRLLEKVIEKYGYESRSALVRDLVRDLLKKEGLLG